MSDLGKQISILGVPVSSVDMTEAVDRIVTWAKKRESRYVCAADVHSVMRARSDLEHFDALRLADMTTPDGQPLVWTARMRGDRHIARVSGPDLMPAVCRASVSTGLRHYFWGGSEGVAAAVAERLRQTYPGLDVAGAETPPFRPMTPAEDEALGQRLKDLRVNVLWIALGCPKQERWMLQHIGKFPGIVMIGVGAAFDFECKRITRAPLWMRRSGLEWLHRLASEPQRLWRRYLVLAPQFVVASLAETIVGALPPRIRAARSS